MSKNSENVIEKGKAIFQYNPFKDVLSSILKQARDHG